MWEGWVSCETFEPRNEINSQICIAAVSGNRESGESFSHLQSKGAIDLDYESDGKL